MTQPTPSSIDGKGVPEDISTVSTLSSTKSLAWRLVVMHDLHSDVKARRSGGFRGKIRTPNGCPAIISDNSRQRKTDVHIKIYFHYGLVRGDALAGGKRRRHTPRSALLPNSQTDASQRQATLSWRRRPQPDATSVLGGAIRPRRRANDQQHQDLDNPQPQDVTGSGKSTRSTH